MRDASQHHGHDIVNSFSIQAGLSQWAAQAD